MRFLTCAILLLLSVCTQATELPFVVSICSFNNAPWVTTNLDSIRKQKHKNWRIIYVDDASTDGTADLVQAYIEKYTLHDKIALIRSEKRMRKLYHLYKTFHSCLDHEIIVQVDGDDTLADANVLTLLNDIFLKHDVWLSYGSHRAKSGYRAGGRKLTKQETEKALFRKPLNPLSIGHLKSFYAWLFKQIKVEDLLTKKIAGWEGRFYPVANDAATVYPMLEMGRHHLWYNSKIVYHYNDRNSACSHHIEKKLQQACAKEIVNSPIYAQVDKPIINSLKDVEYARADCVIFSSSPAALQKLLASCNEFLCDVDRYMVLYEAQNQQDADEYQAVASKFSGIALEVHCAGAEFVQALQHGSNQYIVCLHDGIVLRKQVSCNAWIRQLERTGAYACYGTSLLDVFSAHGVAYQQIDNGLYAWQFACDKQTIVNPHNFALSLYRKEDFLERFATGAENWADCIQNWLLSKITDTKIGLFFE